MSRAETIRTGKAGKKELRLVRKDARFFGLADGIRCVEGDDLEDVWRRLHDDAGKSDPKYFGFDGARSRFLHFFPNGFHSKGYTARERDYKLKAKAKLDAGAPLEKAIDGSGWRGGSCRVSSNKPAFHVRNDAPPGGAAWPKSG